MDEKACTKCGTVKALEDFRPDKRSRDRCSSQCRECHRLDEARRLTNDDYRERQRAYGRRWREQNAERQRAYRATYYRANRERVTDYGRLKRYGMSREEYDQQLAAQNGGCALCGCKPTGRKTRLCVDHCHTTGRLRKLLCNNCNTALGYFKDDPALLRAAANYLEESFVEVARGTRAV